MKTISTQIDEPLKASDTTTAAMSETGASSEPKLKTRGKLHLVELPESGEVEISKEATRLRAAKRIRFPKENFKRFQLHPEQYKKTQNAVDEWNVQCSRERAVYDSSLEGSISYSSLFRAMRGAVTDRIAYYRSAEGGALSIEEARERIYGAKIEDEEYLKELFELTMTVPVDRISYSDLWNLARLSPATAENFWEMIKNEARKELENGHSAADSLEPLGQVKDAWTRAKYIAVRESFITEYKPNGGIELSMIDLLAQSWLMVQHWTNEVSQRTLTEPRRLPYEYRQQVEWQKKANPRGWEENKWHWEVPTIGESAAIEQAAQMLDRFQKMYFRALRQLRDWRRYAPQVTINNPKQVNIGKQVNVASEGGQQINVDGASAETREKLVS